MEDAEKAQRFDELTNMMRSQRDQFRDPKSGLGSAHGQETRDKMANLLDWLLSVYLDEPRTSK